MFGLGLNKQSIEDVPVHNEIPLNASWESITELKTQSKHVAINPPVGHFFRFFQTFLDFFRFLQTFRDFYSLFETSLDFYRLFSLIIQAESLNSADYVGFINKITDTIIKDIIHEQTMNSGIIGSKLKVSGTTVFVVLYKRVTLLQLKNWRKQFLSIITKQQINQDQVATSFVNFINTQLKE